MPRPNRIQLPSDAPQQHEDQYDHQHQPQAAAGAVAPTSAVSPAWKGAKRSKTKTISKIIPRLIDYPFRWSLTTSQVAAVPFESPRQCEIKKADVAEHPEVFGHVGLLVNEPPGQAGLPFV